MSTRRLIKWPIGHQLHWRSVQRNKWPCAVRSQPVESMAVASANSVQMSRPLLGRAANLPPVRASSGQVAEATPAPLKGALRTKPPSNLWRKHNNCNNADARKLAYQWRSSRAPLSGPNGLFGVIGARSIWPIVGRRRPVNVVWPRCLSRSRANNASSLFAYHLATGARDGAGSLNCADTDTDLAKLCARAGERVPLRAGGGPVPAGETGPGISFVRGARVGELARVRLASWRQFLCVCLVQSTPISDLRPAEDSTCAQARARGDKRPVKGRVGAASVCRVCLEGICRQPARANGRPICRPAKGIALRAEARENCSDGQID